MEQAPLNFQLHPKQAEAIQSTANEILYGGAAGGGKSYLMRVAAILWCTQIPGLQVFLFRRLLPDLIKNHMEGKSGFRQLLQPWVEKGLVQIVEDEIRFLWNGSKIYLCHCAEEKDRYKYLGAEMDVLLIDELTTFTETIYRFLRGRCRSANIELPPDLKAFEEERRKEDPRFRLFPKILCSSNPGGIGHGFVKAMFVDPIAPGQVWKTPRSEGGTRRLFLPARLQDNPSLVEADPEYETRLEGLGSPALVQAYKDGDWNVVAGAYFPEFRIGKHVIEPFAIPKDWTKFRSFDWGSYRPFCCHWWAVANEEVRPQKDVVIPRGALICYREYYGSSAPNVGLKLTVEQVALGIKQREGKSEEFVYSVADPAIFKEDGGPSMAERFSKCGIRFRPADNARLPGWDQVRSRLLGEGARPTIYFFDCCRDIIRTLPIVQHDEHKPEDVDTDSEDHALDSVRYACTSRPFEASRPRVRAKIKTIREVTLNELFQANSSKRRKYEPV